MKKMHIQKNNAWIADAKNRESTYLKSLWEELEKEAKMSCFVVSKSHIDALVTFAIEARRRHRFLTFPVDPEKEPDSFGKILWDANIAAYNERYKENFSAEYHHEEFKRVLSPVEAIKACNCYSYQCSDWGNWDISFAKRLIETIQILAIYMLPGYDEAQWEVID